ncbi:ABC-F family ATP-binding cassette domain-containing protein [Peredibacter sp. HCB2-198]|uniref:ABC-F family ATP-binding cassette domain-containing protein n=1 Tax=Peredibacter sp. HCB2-198 TaxID=3383025 RepID=UPI0038B5221A
MSTLLTLQNLSLHYPHKVIFKDVTFTLNQGDKIGVLGLNGHGKSSLFKVIAGLVTPDTTTPPFIYDKSKDFTFFYVPQELPNLSEWNIENYFFEFHPEMGKLKKRLDKINDQLGMGEGNFDKLINEQSHIYEELTKLGEDKLHAQYVSYLKFFGVENIDRMMSSLSGGEQRKVALSLGLSAPQELILWDEPTNHLDLETIQDFEDELQGSKKTFMIISHDRSLLNNVVDRIIHIQQGKLRSFSGTYEAYLQFLVEDQKRREKELDKLTNAQRRETAWIRRGVQARRTKSKKRIEDYGTLNKTIQDLKSQAHKSVSLNLQSSGRKTKILMSAEDLTLKFGERTLFSGLNFSIAKGDKIALLGRNGVGKSSLLKILLGELEHTSGKVNRAVGLDVGYFSQKREALKDDETPWKMIGEGIDYVISNTGEKRHVASYLENFLFSSDEIKRPIHTFSGGEKNRLQLAQFMKHARDIWIFDEPTNDLDLETIGILEEELRNYEGALIIVGHDRSFINNTTDKCWVLHDGKIENFEAGFSQAELFLEAIHLEEELKKKAPAETKAAPKAEAPASKMTNKERNRYDQLGKEIEKLEAKIGTQKSELENFDYTKFDKKKADEMQAQLAKSEAKMEELFNEWAELEAKL